MLAQFFKKYIGYLLICAAGIIGNVACSQEEDYEAQEHAEHIWQVTEQIKVRALFRAITRGELPEVQRIFSVDGFGRVFARDDRKNTPLHTAAYFGHLPIVQYLLQQPYIDVTAKNDWSETPLHSALGTSLREDEHFSRISDNEGHNNPVAHKNLDVIKSLIEHDADIDEKETWGSTPLSRALNSGLKHEIIECLILHYASVFEGDIQDLQANYSEEYSGWLSQRRAQCYEWLQSQGVPTNLCKLLFQFVSEV